ncbi:MAG: polyphenol oxidase family protein [Gemmatimonadales bacterium]
MSTVDERPIAGAVPRWEIPGWRERFGLIAGVTGRGSDSAAPFDLGLYADVPVAESMRRWAEFRDAFAGVEGMVISRQVHGTALRWHRELPAGWLLLDGLDGHATAAGSRLLLVTVADCVPIYLAAPKHGVIALLHAGWRGTAGGILRAGLDVLHAVAGTDPRDVVMHCGVAICGSCYEVGHEVAEALGVMTTGVERVHVDLRSILADQGAALGVGEVTVSGHCTAHEPAAFFSHRRSGGRDGRMVGYLGRIAAG